jgi:hypothetical protein
VPQVGTIRGFTNGKAVATFKIFCKIKNEMHFIYSMYPKKGRGEKAPGGSSFSDSSI